MAGSLVCLGCLGQLAARGSCLIVEHMRAQRPAFICSVCPDKSLLLTRKQQQSIKLLLVQ